MVGDRDRAQAADPGLGQQHLDRRRAVGRVIGVHVQVDVDQLALAQPSAQSGCRRGRHGAGRRARGRRPPVRRRRGPRTAGRPVLREAAERVAQRAGVRDQPLQMRGQRLRLAGLEQPAELSVGEDLLVDRQPAGDRDGARAERAHERPRGGPVAVGGQHRDVRAVASASDSAALVGAGERHPLAQRPRERRRGAATRGDHTVACQSEFGRQQPQRPQQRPQRGSLLGRRSSRSAGRH